MATMRKGIHATLLAGTAALALASCSTLDADMRGLSGGLSTTDAARQATIARPSPDNRGVLSYPGYQVAVARRGDTVASVAARVGLPAQDLAAYNGLSTGDTLRADEVLALPSRVAEPSPATGATASQIDVTTLAGSAIDRADAARPQTGTTSAITPAAKPAGSATPTPATASGAQPIRHRVVRGETAYSIARLYDVSVRALADWNGLGPEMTVREGQYLLIPVAAAKQPTPPAAATAEPAPGAGSVAPEPPSAAEPLPKNTASAAAPVKEPASPNLGSKQTSSSKLAMPVSGKIIRSYDKAKKSEGIDISASAGASVVAASDGTVAAITRDTDQQQILIIRHSGNLLTIYSPLDAITVKKGDTVKRGQAIGKVRGGNPPFLHFEVREGYESTDPVPFLN